MKMSRLYFLVPLIFALLLLTTAWASLKTMPKKVESPIWSGERLSYVVSWYGIKGGTAQLEVKEKSWIQKREVYPIVSTVRSNDFVSLFYQVDDRVESFFDAKGFYPHRVTFNQKEGKRVRNKSIFFDQVHHHAVQIKNNKVRIFDVPARVQDSLSSLYFFRTMGGVEVGGSVFINVHEETKNWNVEVNVLGKERITTPAGTFDTLKVHSNLPYEGIFLDKGDLFIWFTDDENRIPVMMNGKVKIGRISAKLSSRQVKARPFDG